MGWIGIGGFINEEKYEYFSMGISRLDKRLCVALKMDL